MLSNVAYTLKHNPDRPRVKPQHMADEKAEEELSDGGEDILCSTCFQVITSRRERINIQGGHAHTFANPHGIVFDIGCFRSANCWYAGRPSAEFTWFRGFYWRMALCAACLVHVGWLFISGGDYRFHGLIFDRLIIPADNPG